MNRAKSVPVMGAFLLLLSPTLWGDEGKGLHGDPLPPGAVARMGTVRLDSIYSIAFSPDGKTLASGGLETTIRLWETAAAKEVFNLKGHQSCIFAVAFSPDGKLLASGSDDRTIRLWDVATGKELSKLAGHADSVTSVAFSPDGKLLASGSDDETIRLWDVATGKEVSSLKSRRPIKSIAFSPNGETLVSVGMETTIRLWETATAKEVLDLEGHQSVIDSVTFSPDGRLLASGGDDQAIRLWETATGKEVAKLEGHTDSVMSVAFSPDGKLLASGSDDKTVRLWDVATGKEVSKLEGHQGVVETVAFSPDGKTLASGGADTTLLVWGLREGLAPAPLGLLLPAQGIEALWEELGGQDASMAYAAIGELGRGGDATVRFLDDRLQPASIPDAQRLASLIAQLEDAAFERREEAQRALLELGAAAEGALRKTLEREGCPPETRAVAEGLLELSSSPLLEDPALLRRLRAVQVLERVGTLAAKDLLKKLAGGAPGARVTREAVVALTRLEKR